MKKNLSFIIASLVIIFFGVPFGCDLNKGNHEEITITIATENDIQTLDPTILSDPYTSRIVWQIYEGLLGLDDHGNPMPLIAESWSANENNTIWTFKIRPEVFFHKSGVFKSEDSTRSVIAKDVLYSFERFAKGFGSFVFTGLVAGFDQFVKNQTTSISGFKVADSMTFQFMLTRPDPSFIYRITSPYLGVIPREAIENSQDAFGKTISVGTGPFEFEKRSETEVYLRRNKDYWKKTDGNLDRVIFRVEKNQQLRLTQFETGNYSLIQLPVSLAPKFLTGNLLNNNAARKYALYSKTTFNIHYLGINCQTISDIHLRRAIAFAIDKHIIVQKLLYGQAAPATSPVIPGMQGYNPPEGLMYNPDSAKYELTKSNYKGKTIELFVSDAPNSEQIGQIIQNELKKIGIKIEIVKLDFNTLISRLFSNERPDLFLMFSEWIFSAPELIIDSYDSKKFPNPNVFAYSNKKVDSLISQIPHLMTREEINDQCLNLESIALQEVPAAWLFHQKNVYLMDKRLSQFSVNAHNYWNLSSVYFE